MKFFLFLYIFWSHSLHANTGCFETEMSAKKFTDSHPVPEYSAEHVFMHQLAKEFGINPYRWNAASTSAGYNFKGYDNLNYMFVRDYFPFQVKSQLNGQFKSVFVSYPSVIHNGRAFLFEAAHTKGKPPSPSSKFLSFDSPKGKKEFWAEVRKLPLLIEGGNVLLTNARIIVGQKVVHDNSLTENQLLERVSFGQQNLQAEARRFVQNVKENGWKTRSRDEVITELSKAFEVGSDQITILDRMPVEKTGHVDMFVGTLKEGVLAVPEIPQKVIDQLGYRHEQESSVRMNRFLNEQSQVLSKIGYRIVRLPMLSPKNLVQGEKGWEGKVLSPVNWLMDGRTIKVPHFPKTSKHVSNEIASAMQNQIKDRLEREGFKVEFVDAERLADTKGLLHCISAQYDLTEFADLKNFY